ncbi:LPXTG cell wall anchor domain-containing protein [Lactococcus petauri]|nr:LPXTG cell wall anchor domain-containing protein [Lactococcus petauri]
MTSSETPTGGTSGLSTAPISKSGLGSLPSTGEQDSSALGLLGMGLAGMLGLAGRRKKRNSDQ